MYLTIQHFIDRLTLFTNTITSYAIIPRKQNCNELTFVHKHTHICIHTLDLEKITKTYFCKIEVVPRINH